MGVKRRILRVKRILLSFPQYLSDVADILHEVQQCTPNFFHQFDQHPQMLRKNTFFDSVRREKSMSVAWFSKMMIGSRGKMVKSQMQLV
jgi:hypothetical protein